MFEHNYCLKYLVTKLCQNVLSDQIRDHQNTTPGEKKVRGPPKLRYFRIVGKTIVWTSEFPFLLAVNN